VVPHRFDRPFEAASAHALGLGQKPLPARKATRARLSAAIETATRDPGIQATVTRMIHKLKRERRLVEARERVEAFARRHSGSCAAR
jgi:UDP:flavonoid glycosyltransferase YjiC (YdhE family)